MIDGKRLFNRADMSALPDDGTEPEILGQPDRVFLLSKMTPYQRIHSLCKCLDRDARAKDFRPWTEVRGPRAICML